MDSVTLISGSPYAVSRPTRLPTTRQLLSSMTAEWKEKVASQPIFAQAGADVETLERFVADAAMLIRMYAALTEAERFVLIAVLQQFAHRPFSERQAVKSLRAWRLPEPYVRVALLRLRQQAILFMLQNKWNEKLLMVPADTFGLWQRICMPIDPASAADSTPSADTLFPAPPPAMLDQLLSFLTYVACQQPRLTKQGKMYKQVVRRLQQTISIDPEQLTAIAAAWQLVGQVGNRLMVDESELVARYGDKSQAEVQRLLYRFVRDRLLAERAEVEPAEVHFLYWLEQCKDSRTYSIESYIHWLEAHRFGTPIEPRMLRQMLRERWLEPLAQYGLLWLGENGTAFRLQADRTIATEKRSLYITPNLEVIVLPSADFGKRWEVELLGEREGAGETARFILTKASITRAAWRWHGPNELCEWLDAHSRTGVPDSVKSTLRLWMQVNDRPSASSAIVHDTMDKEAASAAASVPSPGWWPDPHYPHVKQLYPARERVPVAWFRQFASYHRSTKRKIVEQAIAWKVLIRAHISGQSTRTFIPERLTEETEGWTVMGTETRADSNTVLNVGEIRLTEKQIEKVQLIVPELEKDINC